MTQQTKRIYKIYFNWRQYADATEADEDYEIRELGKSYGSIGKVHGSAKVTAIYIIKFNDKDVVRVEYDNRTAEEIHSHINRIFYEVGK